MQREEFFEPDKVNIDNINALSIEQSISFEKRICEIAEISDVAAAVAEELINDGFGIYEMLGFISDAVSFSSSEGHGFVMPESAFKIKKYLGAISSYDKTVFADVFTKRLLSLGLKISEADFLPEAIGDGSVVYVKNRLADEAYDVFADGLHNSTVSYVENLRDAAAAVADGKKEYCILPLEEKGGARLASIAAILFSYDLKIASVTPVFGFDGSADVKYALVSRHFNIPSVAPDDDRYLEIRLPQDSSLSLTALFSAAEMLGSSVYRINTVRFDSEEGANAYYTVVFKDEGKDFSTLLVFLTLFAGSYTAVGIYKNLE